MPPADLRLALPAGAAWTGALVGTTSVPAALTAVGVGALTSIATATLAAARRRRLLLLATACCLVAGAAAAGLRVAALSAGPVGALAGDGATISATGRVLDDPRPTTSKSGPGPPRRLVTLSVELSDLLARGERWRLRTPVLVVAAPRGWLDLRPGQNIRLGGRLAVATGGGPVAAVLRARGEPTEWSPPGFAARATEPLRQGLRDSVAGLAPAPGGLVPALVVGDESAMTDQVRATFQTTGLTHLTAVSGANVAIVLVFVVGLARWCGVRGYGLPVVGGLAVVGFVLLARPEPSVLRAAAMGLIAVAGLSAGSRRGGVPALCAATLALVLVDPWLARAWGFVLSVVATAGILVLAPPCRDAMCRWLPRPAAEAVAVPLAAQVVCTPIVAVLSDTVSLAAVPANLVVAAAVAPATVLGLVAALLAPVAPAAAGFAGWLAGWPAGWITWVAERGAALPGASLGWAGHGMGLLLLVALAVAAALLLPRLLRRPYVTLVAAAGVLLAVLQPFPRPGWPVSGWVLVACDVGQGDAIVLAEGPGRATVVDTGPDPGRVRGCLDRLGIREVTTLVLTHLHADHVDGLAGVLAGRTVSTVLVSPVADAADQAARVRRLAAAAGARVDTAVVGDRGGTGSLSWRVLWPARAVEGGSRSNNASVVLRVDTPAASFLLTGDIERQAQRALLAADPRALRVDVLKVAHHGSASQDPGFLDAVGASLDLVSVGIDNDYGHPAPALVQRFRREGDRVARTDLEGDIAVVDLGGRLGLATSGPSP